MTKFESAASAPSDPTLAVKQSATSSPKEASIVGSAVGVGAVVAVGRGVNVGAGSDSDEPPQAVMANVEIPRINANITFFMGRII